MKTFFKKIDKIFRKIEESKIFKVVGSILLLPIFVGMYMLVINYIDILGIPFLILSFVMIVLVLWQQDKDNQLKDPYR